MTSAILGVFRYTVVVWLFFLVLMPALAEEGMKDAADLAREVGHPTQLEKQLVQPYNNAPIWRTVRSGEAGFTTVQGNVPETGVLIQAGGEIWRSIRNGPIKFYGGILILAVPLIILGFYLIKGSIRLHDKPTGRLIERFNGWERLVHWVTAISFVILAVTGLIMLFGTYVLLPVIGYTLFSWLARFSINLHNYIGPLFILCVLAMIFTYIRDNLWKKHDWLWFKKAGGMLTGEHVPSGRFNAGEKTWFWVGVFFLSLLVGATGLVLDFANFGQGRTLMQQAHVVHVIAALIYIAAFFGHLYMGTMGTEGAYAAMRHGYVDETWAREHHEYWYKDIKAGKAPSGEVKPADRAPPMQPAEK